MSDYAYVAVLVASIMLQLAAAVVTVLNIRLTAARGAWAMLSTAIVLMGVRRSISFVALLRNWDSNRIILWQPELTALLISILMLCGMIALRWYVLVQHRTIFQKDQLLRSSLHTTKNHLQSLESLINLQAGFTESEESRTTMTELGQRVAVYALLQRQLYETEVNPDFRAYLRALAASVVEAYHALERRVQVELQLEPLEVTSRDLLTCGMVVSEAMINTCKYVAGPSSSTMITIRSGNEPCRWIEISDNGPGYGPENLDGTRIGFGLTYFRSLESNRARVHLANRDGALVRYEF